ncbi:hypothetical protein K505DRAFT_321262 [Melanomma pulvis-pyrius CBS 109.77]|uniref:Uncharacterized protein n=1 Tax=Melanomma pulvis-pyrius CBS 109.77 TaxID=1314802 RepID=A0A6A6XUP2_9PLEO|nr:hypothetical protein K505DRAFT_321262 [Melanomma pulvis-pyrius CBS 109.77]
MARNAQSTHENDEEIGTHSTTATACEIWVKPDTTTFSKFEKHGRGCQEGSQKHRRHPFSAPNLYPGPSLSSRQGRLQGPRAHEQDVRPQSQQGLPSAKTVELLTFTLQALRSSLLSAIFVF